MSVMFEMSTEQIRIKFGSSGKKDQNEIEFCFMF